MTSNCRWVVGPTFLCESEEHWPSEDFTGQIPDEDAELKKTVWCGLLSDPPKSQPDPTKFSSWTRFRRVIAWINRFVVNSRLPVEGHVTRPLSVDELTLAEMLAVKRAQMESFPEDREPLLEKIAPAAEK